MLLLLVIVSAVVVVAAGIAAGRAPGASALRWLHWLRWAALGTAAVAAVMLAPTAIRDAGWFAAVLLGVPVALAAVPVIWDLTGARAASAVNWVAAVLALCWAVLLALGIGFALLPAAMMQLAAAAATSATAQRASAGRAE